MKNNTENSVANKEMGAKLQAVFDTIADNFDPNDGISVENANYEMHKYWHDFLEAGFDATSVVKMMLPADIWEHWDELVERAVSPDILADRCYDDCDIYDVVDLEELLAKGVSAKKSFELIGSLLEVRETWPEEQVEILTWLYNHGLSKTDVKEWLERHTNSHMEDYIVESGSDFYKKFDMEDDGIIDHWLNRYGYQYFSEYRLSDLPDTISVDKLISFFSMKEIIDNCSPYSFDDFISDYLETGKDIDTLAQKFMDEIGYSSDASDSGAMLDLVYAGASVDIIDPAKYIVLVDANQLDDCEARNWYDYFESEGYDEKLIHKFLR